jgi:hypothetical protein
VADPRHELDPVEIAELHGAALEFADVARDIIVRACAGGFTVERKHDGSYVTNVDLEVEDRLRGLIAKRFPEHGILGEEFPPARPGARFQWILDPIDGTEDSCIACRPSGASSPCTACLCRERCTDTQRRFRETDARRIPLRAVASQSVALRGELRKQRVDRDGRGRHTDRRDRARRGEALHRQVSPAQRLDATLMDYALPRSDDIPPVVIDHLETPSPLNPLGFKGVGESGTLPVPAVVASAVEDAVGVRVEEMPITSAALRRLLAPASS